MSNLALLQACGACVSSYADRFVPGILWYSLLGIVWFLTTSFACALFGKRPAFFPGVISSLVLVLLSGIVGAATLGPIIALGLGGLAIAVFYSALRRGDWLDGNEGVRWVLCQIGGVFVLVGLILGAWSAYVLSQRSLAEYVIDWSASAGGRAALRELVEQEPASLPEYRALLRDAPASCSCLGFVASRVEEVGTDEEVPLLLDALERLESEPGHGSEEERAQIGQALEALSGLRPVEGAASDHWRKVLQSGAATHDRAPASSEDEH